MKQRFALPIALLVLRGLALGQATPELPVLEAVDVHPSAAGTSPSGRFSLPDGRFEFYGTTMRTFIRFAWGFPEEQIDGVPSWIDSDRFDIIGKTAKTVPVSVQTQLLRKILADRFGLAVHTGEKPLAAMLLTASKRVQIKPNADPDAAPKCQPNVRDDSQRVLTCQNATMATLASLLRDFARPDISSVVVDKTGLTGTYDFILTWKPRALFGAEGGTSVFEAVEKQLGLKLEAGTVPMTMLTVDRVNRTPTENLPNAAALLTATAPKEFEVATVRLNKTGVAAQRLFIQPSGRLDVSNFPLRGLIAFAWNVEPEMVVNGEKWLESDHYDIAGTGANTGSIDVIRQMLQAVLIDRFKLTIHREDRPMAVFAIEQSKRGPKLKDSSPESVSNCKVSDAETRRLFTCTNTTMAQFAERLHPQTPNSLPHPIVDLTELKGSYDFVLSWTRPLGPGQLLPPPSAAPAAQAGQSALTAETPAGTITLAEAFESELGLKISEQKHPMPVVVIDHIERTPTEN